MGGPPQRAARRQEGGNVTIAALGLAGREYLEHVFLIRTFADLGLCLVRRAAGSPPQEQQRNAQESKGDCKNPSPHLQICSV